MGYRKLISPLLALTRGNAGGAWEPRHTEALNTIAELVLQRFKLGVIDMAQRARLYLSLEDGFAQVVLTQGEGHGFVIIGMGGRYLTPTETKLPVLERWLVIAHWGIKRFARYTVFLPQVIVVLPTPADCVMVKKETIHMNIQGRLMELKAMANVTFENGDGAEIIQGTALRSIHDQPDEEVAKLRKQRAESSDSSAVWWEHPAEHVVKGVAATPGQTELP